MQPLTPRQLFDCTEGQPRSCDPGYCDLWLLSAKVDAPEREILETVLSPRERDYSGRFRFQEDRERSIVARGGLRRILSSYCCTPPRVIEFHTGSHGKPSLLKPASTLEFNISHSGECVLIAVTSGVPCGVDIERRRVEYPELGIAEEFFCPRELAWLSRTKNGFLRIWAVKEAIVKAMGLGLSFPLSDIDTSDVLEGKTSAIMLRTRSEPQIVWLNELSLLPNYAAAVATIQGRRALRLRPD